MGRLDMAGTRGDEHLINQKIYAGLPELIAAVKVATKGRGAHLAFQCTGVPAAVSNIWKYVSGEVESVRWVLLWTADPAQSTRITTFAPRRSPFINAL